MTTPTTRPMNATDKALAALRAELALVNECRDRLGAAIAALTSKTASTPKLAHTPRKTKRHHLRGEQVLARNSQIVAAYARGDRPMQIARTFGITSARVHQILTNAGVRAHRALGATEIAVPA